MITVGFYLLICTQNACVSLSLYDTKDMCEQAFAEGMNGSDLNALVQHALAGHACVPYYTTEQEDGQ